MGAAMAMTTKLKMPSITDDRNFIVLTGSTPSTCKTIQLLCMLVENGKISTTLPWLSEATNIKQTNKSTICEKSQYDVEANHSMYGNFSLRGMTIIIMSLSVEI